MITASETPAYRSAAARGHQPGPGRGVAIWLALFLMGTACQGKINGGDDGFETDDTGGASGKVHPENGGAGAGMDGKGGTGGTAAATGSGPDGKGQGGNGAGNGNVPPSPVSSTRFARLSHVQWENTVRDLFRLTKATNLSSTFIRDPISGFDNAGDILAVSPDLRNDYERAAEALATQVAGDPAALAKIVPGNAPADAAGKARAFIKDFGLRAYRRPLEDSEVQEYLDLFNQGPTLVGGDAFAAGANLVVRSVLQSPFFVYRTELGTKQVAGRIPLSDYEVAAKLSYALANTMPDDAMTATAASAAGLHSKDAVTTQAHRLLDGPTASALYDNFNLQVYQLPKYDTIGAKDKTLYAAFQASLPNLPADTKQETLLFTREVLEQGMGLSDLLTGSFTFVNARLANIYGLSGIFNETFARTNLDPTQRAGILTQIGFLASRAGSVEPDPVHRGLYVIEGLICDSVPPPLPNVTEPMAAAGKTNRQIWEAHTGTGTCAPCHAQKINPVGFAFEGMDAIGRVRTQDNGQPVDTSGFYNFTASGEKKFNGPVELAKTLAEAPEVSACYARQWLSYLYGRTLQDGDNPEIQAVGTKLRTKGTAVKSVILDVVTSDSFLTRAP